MAISRNLRGSPRNFKRSIRALAIPVTFLILFVSLMTVISATYYFAVTKFNSKGRMLKISTAKQNMLSLENRIKSVTWSPGASETYEFDDCGGKLKVIPSVPKLVVKLLGDSLNETLYDGFIGEIVYELPSAEQADVGLFLKGSSDTVTNKSEATMTMLYIEGGDEHPEIILRYRPAVSIVTNGVKNGKPLNIMRIYVVSLNSSQNIELKGKVPLKISCSNVVSTFYSYNISDLISRLRIESSMDGVKSQVYLPVSSNGNGAFLEVEVITCQISVERWLR